jgi:hypothetical protein
MYPPINPKKQVPEPTIEHVNPTVITLPKNCEYCSAPAIATIGQPDDYRWCGTCQRDLLEFATLEVSKRNLIEASDRVAISWYRVELHRKEEDFMREKIKERKPQRNDEPTVGL